MIPPLPCLHRRIHSRVNRSGVMWWCAVVLSCVLVWSAQDGGHVLVRAQFGTNPTMLDADHALVLNGIVTGDQSGFSVAGVGDVNEDGVDDFVLGARFASNSDGQAYLLFGRNASTPWTPNPFELSALDGTNGVTFQGLVGNDRVGSSVAGVSDVNGDGINDMIIGSQLGDVAYLVFGLNGTWPSVVNLTQGAFNGVTIVGSGATAVSVSSAGDVNNDGVPDIVIGAALADTPAGGAFAGHMAVLFGRPSGSPWPDRVNLTTYVNASTGFALLGESGSGFCGESVSGVGDVNDDGVDDVAVSCANVNVGNVTNAGLVAVVFGSSSALPVEIAPSQLNGTNGFVVNGRKANGKIGRALSCIGDVNADGLSDFAIGAPDVDANELLNSGEMYVLFGRNCSANPWPAQVNVGSLDGNNGFTLAGSLLDDDMGRSVGAAGDVNADGIDDVVVGASRAGAGDRGLVYLLYGRVVWPAAQNSSDLEESMSQTFQGNATWDNCGVSVSRLGDVNGDGRGDLAIGCVNADPGGKYEAGQTVIVFGPLFTSAPTTTTASPTTAPTTAGPTTTSPTAAPTTTSVTASPTPSTCATQGAFVPPGATCVSGVLVTTANTTAPADTAATVATSVTVTGGASFEQPSGSTLVFVAGASGGSTSIVVQDGGCATIAGDAVVSFEADPSNNGGGDTGNTGTLVLVTADCVMGAFGSVSATTSFEGDECVAIGDGEQVAGGSSISVSFAVSNTCDSKSSGLSTAVLVGIIGGAAVVVVAVVIVAVWQKRKRVQRREATLAGISMHQ